MHNREIPSQYSLTSSQTKIGVQKWENTESHKDFAQHRFSKYVYTVAKLYFSIKPSHHIGAYYNIVRDANGPETNKFFFKSMYDIQDGKIAQASEMRGIRPVGHKRIAGGLLHS